MKRLLKSFPMIYIGLTIFWLFSLSLENITGGSGKIGELLVRTFATQMSLGCLFVFFQFIILLGFPSYVSKLSKVSARVDVLFHLVISLNLLGFVLSSSSDSYVGLEYAPKKFNFFWYSSLFLLVAWAFFRLVVAVRLKIAENLIQKYLLVFYAIIVGLLSYIVVINAVSFVIDNHLIVLSVYANKMLYHLLSVTSVIGLLFAMRPTITQFACSFMNFDKSLIFIGSSYFLGSLGLSIFEFNGDSGFEIVVLSGILGGSYLVFFVCSLELAIKKMLEQKSEFILSGSWIPFLMLPISFLYLGLLSVYGGFTQKILMYDQVQRLLLLVFMPAILFFYKEINAGNSNVTASISRALFFVGSTVVISVYVLIIRFGFSIATFELPLFLPMYKIMLLGFGFLIIAMAIVLWDRILYEWI